MKSLRYTLLTDGPSDRCLTRIIDAVLNSVTGVRELGILPQYADPRDGPKRAPTLSGRMAHAIAQYPCDILFVHRDAEREPMTNRVREIMTAAAEIEPLYCVPVVPIRMTEAWLLLEERAIRDAADNPNGTVPLSLPRVTDLESIPDPKAVLDSLLERASEKHGRRLARFKRDLSWRRSRLASLIKDFTPLESVTAFAAFRTETHSVVGQWLSMQSSS